ncbi:MAG: hypothetical protein GTO63_22795 [Anaerolineae bacterium]|nr:hypothetical protein [Anaerolineae bacterium]
MSAYRTCPICGASVKLENMSAHMSRVHPRTKAAVSTREVQAEQKLPGRKLLYALLAVVLLVVPLAIYGLTLTSPWAPSGDGVEPPTQAYAVDVYLQATCGCCHQYLNYLESNGFDLTPHEMTDLSGVRASQGIPGSMQSCHTAIVEDYFVEGHVPVAAIQRLLEERPAIDGIALPDMPAGSPGMGGIKAAPFVIYAVEGGQATVFMEI